MSRSSGVRRRLLQGLQLRPTPLPCPRLDGHPCPGGRGYDGFSEGYNCDRSGNVCPVRVFKVVNVIDEITPAARIHYQWCDVTSYSRLIYVHSSLFLPPVPHPLTPRPRWPVPRSVGYSLSKCSGIEGAFPIRGITVDSFLPVVTKLTHILV